MKFTHINKKKEINMVDISEKKITSRVAKAKGKIKFSKSTFKKISENTSPKGEIFNTARLAGTLAAKKTNELIPLCHNINLNLIEIQFKKYNRNSTIEVISVVKTDYKTGVEMEALTACSVACLTIYDMCKSIDKKIIINEIKLIFKSGGKSGNYANEDV